MNPDSTDQTILVTGAGGAAAVTLIRALGNRYRMVAVDIDPLAVGLYLVPPDRRALICRGEDPSFVPDLLALAVEHGADLVIPTVDLELAQVAAARAQFEAYGIAVLVESPATLEKCLDKWGLVQACAPTVRVPKTVVFDQDTTDESIASLGTPFIIKPRSGAGGRGFAIIASGELPDGTPRDGSMILQEHLPGEEFSIDVLGRPDGAIVAAVPRRRDKVDSGIAVAGRTVHDADLINFGRRVAETIGVVGVVNVQAKRAADGTPALLEVNPRFPGTMALTMAAGVDMPNLAVDAALGHSIPEQIDFTEVAVVRHWDEIAVPIDEYANVRERAGSAR